MNHDIQKWLTILNPFFSSNIPRVEMAIYGSKPVDFPGFSHRNSWWIDSSSQDMVSALIYPCMSIILRDYFGYVQARDVSPYMIGCWWVVLISEGQTCWHRKKPRRCQAQKGIGQLLTVSNGTTTLSSIFDLYLTCCCVTSVRNQERGDPRRIWMDATFSMWVFDRVSHGRD